jgi:hypothetical protein
MSIDEKVNEAERKVLEEINKICEGTLKFIGMDDPRMRGNWYRSNEEGSVFLLYFSFGTLNLDKDKFVLLGEHIKKLEKIKMFIVSRAKYKIFFECLKELKNIKHLRITNSFLTSIPEFIKEFKNLEEMEIGDNEIKILPEWLPTLPKLNFLKTHTQSRSDMFGSSLEFNQQNIDIMRALKEKNVEISDSIFRLHFDLGLPKEITKVILEIKNKLGENFVTGHDSLEYGEVVQVWGVVDFLFLDGNMTVLSINGFQLKELPESIGKLNKITELEIIDNELTSLPESFGELKELKELDLSENQLTSLPESFVNLTSLTKLNLSNNEFTEIPTQLWALKELTDLNLSNNPLSDEEQNVIQKVPDLIREYLRVKATIVVFISHAVIDYEPYRVGDLVEYLEKQKEISQVFFCEEDLAGNIDEWMLNAVQKSQLILYIGTNKSVFNSVDCDNELQLADKFSIPVIPLKGKDIDWPDLAEKNLSRELGLEYDTDNFDDFCSNVYKYVENFKREINLMEKEERRLGIIDIYERFRLMLDERLDGLDRKIDERLDGLDRKIDEVVKKINDLAERMSGLENITRE